MSAQDGTAAAPAYGVEEGRGQPNLRIAVSEVAPAGWDDLVLAGTTGSLHLFHTGAWARRLAETASDVARYHIVYDGDEPRVLLLGFYERPRYGHDQLWRRLGRMVRAQLRRKKHFRWYGQPILLNAAELEMRLLAETLAAETRVPGTHLAGGEWPLAFEAVLPSDWPRHRWATLKVDLAPELACVVDHFKPAARKEIRKAQSQGIEVRRIASEEELRRYAEEAVRCAARYGKANASVDDYLCCWRCLRTPPSLFETFAAYRGAEFLAGLSVWGTTRGIAELGSFQSELSFTEKLAGPDYVKWHVIEWAHAQGIRYFDLSGVNPAPIDSKEQGIRRFKEKWGGAYEEYVVVEG